jgi:Arc/MetJ family transcription regulator
MTRHAALKGITQPLRDAWTGLKTKRAIVEEALRLLIRLHRQADIRSLRGKLRWEGDLGEMRESHFAGFG